MIAVEWLDHDAPRDKDNKSMLRNGLLLQVSPTTRDPVNIAFVITKCEQWDRDAPYPRDDRNIIKALKLSELTVKGVHIPFEPYEGAK